MSNLLRLLVFSIAFAYASASSAQVNLEKDSVTKKGKKKKLFAFPAVIYSPETTLAFGGAGNFYFKLGRDSVVRTSYIQALGLYTLRKQAVLGMESIIFFHNENFILKTKASASYFPDRFWGLGDNSTNDFERYTVGQFYLFPQLLRKTYKKLFLGPAFEIQNVFSFEYGSGMPPGTSKFDLQNVPGRKGSYIAGLGAVASWDSRDNAFSPSKGFYFSYYFGDFSPAFGSKYRYTSHTLDVRKYFPVKKNSVIAMQLVMLINNGTVPVRSMANIGSNSIMRGYYEGRYTDNNLVALQSEYRFPVYKRFGMVFFAAAGRVASTADNLITLSSLKPSLGTGLRYAIDPKEKLNFRFDVGFGQQSNGFYFYITEAF
ncbi:MAG: BamA/TamA family outer membrane protein [Bacteroidetes bacterium]|nr:BamA/TamA family outer membrane protein [Bacteroidota bacterium]